jgi:CheY-like chemotaxis protein
MSQANKSFSILIVDDNEAIHDDLKKILLPETVDPSLSADEALLFGTQSAPAVVFAIDSAFQGQQSLALVRKALAEDRPYAMAFIDVRMPPGWDGIETIEHLWEADPDLQVVICTAYSDYDWNVISQRLGVSENFVILRKPFDNIEVSQLAHALTAKWTSMRLARLRVEELDRQVEERTADLRKTEEKYRAIFEDAVIGIFQASPNGKLITVNRAFASMHGYDSVEQLLAHPHDVMIEMAQIKRWTQTLEEQDVVRGAEVEVN